MLNFPLNAVVYTRSSFGRASSNPSSVYQIRFGKRSAAYYRALSDADRAQ